MFFLFLKGNLYRLPDFNWSKLKSSLHTSSSYGRNDSFRGLCSFVQPMCRSWKRFIDILSKSPWSQVCSIFSTCHLGVLIICFYLLKNIQISILLDVLYLWGVCCVSDVVAQSGRERMMLDRHLASIKTIGINAYLPGKGKYLKPIHRLLLNIAFLGVISFCVPYGWFILFQYILIVSLQCIIKQK